ncbi:competence protein [Tetragenococcus koreensis]|uniref:Competence protein CoiA n=1 Tax=Tetragenococcus koreensis TaxID=290335 RepID=A0AAN4RLW1_9ENTE|nr:competence protein CoiA family protein [Tetragenococcus koreensis]MCF1584308.1 competence protein [Tetragenococcus koreensis]MCF1614677.1 competence protein [Tetragenococcus koreensis]MCF1617931.1 competence protein [Tetragenococcus koreensis]MCF1620647.1 competence protein [Tetragenococcus koreensis]MCF1622752.1 competence protein [Tetragenococcus koreensis]
MLIANSSSGARIDARTFKQEKNYAGPLFCPSCHEPVFYKHGKVNISHFAHFSQAACASFSEGETYEHLSCKDFIASWLQGGQLEAYLPKLQQRPDILYKNMAIEVQCSMLPIERYVERTQNYLAHGYFPWWLFGKKLSPKNKFTNLQKAGTYYHQKYGFYLWLSKADEKEIWLLYHIRWHYRWGFFYRIKKWQPGDLPLTKLFTLIADKPLPVMWDTKQYRFFIYKKLAQKQLKAIRLQEKLYLMGTTFQDLPDWCYKPSLYQFFFEDELLFLRFCYLKTNSFSQWLQKIKLLAHPWLYPLVSQKEILQAIYVECQELVRN